MHLMPSWHLTASESTPIGKSQKNIPIMLLGSRLSHSRLLVIFALLLIEFTLLLSCCILVLLVLRHQVVHVAFCLCELHFIHTLSCIPVQEGFTTEHRSEVFCDPLEHFLNRCGVSREGNRHLQALRWNVANRRFDIVGDPFHEVRRVLILHIQHLFIHLFRGHATTEKGCGCQVTAMSGVGSTHHVFGVEHLLRKFGYCQSTVLLRTTRSQGRKTRHEEVKPGKRNEVHCDLTKIAIQLPWKAKTSCNTTHCRAHQMIEISIRRCSELQRAEANVRERFVIQQEALISILDQLVERQYGIVGLNNCIGHLRRGKNGESLHDAVRILLADFRDKQSAHTRTSTAAKRMAHLKTLQSIASLGL